MMKKSDIYLPRHSLLTPQPISHWPTCLREREKAVKAKENKQFKTETKLCIIVKVKELRMKREYKKAKKKMFHESGKKT